MKPRRSPIRRVRLRYSSESRLRQPAEFRHVYDAQQKIAGKYFVLYYREKELVDLPAKRDREGKERAAKKVKPRSRVGICASRKIGKAVQRNRAKRILRESWRHMAPGIVRGYDIVLNGRAACTEATMKEVRLDLWKALRKLRLLTKGAAGSPDFWLALQGGQVDQKSRHPEQLRRKEPRDSRRPPRGRSDRRDSPSSPDSSSSES